MITLINKLLDREIKAASEDIKTIAGCMDKDRKETRLNDAIKSKKQFNKLTIQRRIK